MADKESDGTPPFDYAELLTRVLGAARRAYTKHGEPRRHRQRLYDSRDRMDPAPLLWRDAFTDAEWAELQRLAGEALR